MYCSGLTWEPPRRRGWSHSSDIDWPLLHSSGRPAQRTPDPVQDAGEGGFLFWFYLLQLRRGQLHDEATRAEPDLHGDAQQIERAADGSACGNADHRNRSIEQYHDRAHIPLVQQGLMPATAAIPIVIGANIGTTVTALEASTKMHKTARSVAVANLCFNAFGVLLFLPFLGSSQQKR